VWPRNRKVIRYEFIYASKSNQYFPGKVLLETCLILKPNMKVIPLKVGEKVIAETHCFHILRKKHILL
jgi:hypothetical protein